MLGYFLSVLFLALLSFLYLQTRQFIEVVRALTVTLSELKAFSMGKPAPDEPRQRFIPQPPSDPDFGEGVMIGAEKADGMFPSDEDM